MKVNRADISELLAERTMHLQDRTELTQEIAAYLLSERRVDELPSIVRDVMQIRAENGLLEATVVSAYDMSTEVERDVRSLLKTEYPDAKHIMINSKIDPDVIGGLRIDMPNEQLDMTLRKKLSIFKRLTVAEEEL